MSVSDEILLQISEKGACSGSSDSVDVFFPLNGGKPIRAKSKRIYEEEAGRRFCNRCVVKNECFEWGNSNRQEGIWGGEYLYPDHIRKKSKGERNVES